MAQLLAADFLPGTWVADDLTRVRRRLVARRMHLVRQNTRSKNQVHAILARNLVPTCPHSDLFSGVGRRWLASQVLPPDEQRSVAALLRQPEFHTAELAAVDHDIALDAVENPVIARLMTIPGIDVSVAMAILAAVGDFSRFKSPELLVSYLGLNPRVRQSGHVSERRRPDTSAAKGEPANVGPHAARGWRRVGEHAG